MKDTINRQDAIDALRKEFKRVPTNAIRATQAVENLPPAQPEPQWIPVTKKLPEKNVWVLVTFMMANGEVDTDIMRINRWDGGWDTHTFDMAYRETVIAWMPLPKPWREEDR